MMVAIHQPNFLPWPGFFHKWQAADAFVILDTVQFHKNEWQNRNRIKTAQGARWLTAPVTYRFPQPICEVGLAGGPWVRKLAATVEQAYAQAPHLDAFWPRLKAILNSGHTMLSPLNVALIRELGRMAGCTAPLHLASEMHTREEDPARRLVGLCRELGADAYLSGREGRNYLDRAPFAEAGLDLWFQEVEAPVYPQLHGAFISHLSIMDMLFNVGMEAARIVHTMGGMGR
jgi:WbqC-like protein family